MMTPDIGRLIDELRSSLGALETAFNAIPYAIAFTDMKGRVQWCNAAFERLARRRRVDIMGSQIKKLPFAARASRTPMKAKGKRIGFVYVVALPA